MLTRRSRPDPSVCGFTLIEMIMVVTLVGLLALITFPNIDLTKFRVNSAMQGIGSTFLAAQRLAVTKQHDVTVTFDVAGNAFYLHEDADNDGVVDTGEREIRQPLGEAIVFGLGGAPASSIGPNPVNFTKMVRGRPAVTFHRGGSASEASGFYLTSQRAINSGGRPEDTRAIRVERSTGRASWFRYSGSTWVRGF